MGDGTAALQTSCPWLWGDQISETQRALPGERSCWREDAPWDKAVASPPPSTGSYRKEGCPVIKKKSSVGGFKGGLPGEQGLQKLPGRRGDPAVRVSRDMVPPRGTQLRVSHVLVRVGWTSFQKGPSPCGCSITSQGCLGPPRTWLPSGLVKATSEGVVGTGG